MSKVTTKLQVTVPKAIADRFGIRPGTDLEWVAAGEHIRIVLRARPKPASIRERLRVFDDATVRQGARERERPDSVAPDAERGWTREELYERARPR